MCHLKSEHLEMARMICSFEHLTNMKTILLFTPADNLWQYDSTDHNASSSKRLFLLFGLNNAEQLNS